LKFDDLGEFFNYAVHVVFGVVIGQSFLNSATILVPFSKFFESENAGLTAYQLVLVYFIILTSWIGFFLSTNKSKYSSTRIGMARFGTDFFILFLYYYLLILVTHQVGGHGDIFMYGLPAIFGAYVLWDFLKYLDNRTEAKKLAAELGKEVDIKAGMRTTQLWFIIFMILASLYTAFQAFAPPLLRQNNELWIDVLSTTTAIGLIVYYRIVKLRPTQGGALPTP
jgi:hypothetical protein